MHNRLSPDFKTHRASTFQRESQQTINSQRSAYNNVEDLMPTFIKESPSFNRQLLTIRLSGEASEVLSINTPSLRNELKSTKELNRSNVSIVNQYFNQQGPQNSAREQDNLSQSLEKQSIKTLLDRKDLQVAYFKQELDRLRQQVRIDKANIQNLQESLRQAQLNKSGDNANLQNEKEMLQNRLVNIEKQMELLQREVADKSKISLTLSNVSSNKATEAFQQQKDSLQREVTSLMRRDIEMQNEIQYYKTKVINLEKQLQDTNSDTSQIETYKHEITYQLNILTNLNESLIKENQHLKTTMKHFQSHNKELQGQLAQGRLQLADINIHEEKKLVVLQSEIRTLQRQLEERNFQVSVMEGQLKETANNRTASNTQKDTIVIRLQEEVRSLQANFERLGQQNYGLNRANDSLRLQINEVKIKYQEIEFLAQNLRYENDNIMATRRQFVADESERKHHEQTISKLSSELEEQRMLVVVKQQRITDLSNRLQEKIEEGRLTESDFARIQTEVMSIKNHLKDEVEQLNKEKQIIADSNRDLRLQMQSEANSHNAVVHMLNVKLEDREKRLATLEREMINFESENQTTRITLRNELQQVKTSLRREQMNLQTLQSKLNEQQYRSQQLIREKSDLARELDRVRQDLRLHEQRKAEGQHLTLVVEELKRQINDLEQQAKSNAELSHSRFLNQVSQKSSELLNLQQQYRRTTMYLEEMDLALSQKQNQIQRYRQQHSQVEQLRRIVEECRLQIKHLQMQLAERSSQTNYKLSELQQYEQIFQSKEPKFSQLVKSNINRLIVNKPNESHTNNRRQQLFSQIIEIVQSKGVQIGDLKQYIRDLEGEHRKKLQQLDRLQVEINSLTYENSHLVNEMESLVSRLKYVENYAQYLAGVAKSSDSEGKRLKSLNKNLKTKLEKEFSERQWLQNRVKNSVDTSNPQIEKTKQQRLHIYNMMKEVIDTNKQ